MTKRYTKRDTLIYGLLIVLVPALLVLFKPSFVFTTGVKLCNSEITRLAVDTLGMSAVEPTNPGVYPTRPLLQAVFQQCIPVADDLLRQGASLTGPFEDPLDLSVLHYAASEPDLQLLEWAVAKLENVDFLAKTKKPLIYFSNTERALFHRALPRINFR